jgi:hypothetical protein
LEDAVTMLKAAWTMTSDGSLVFPLAFHGKRTYCSTMAGVSTKVRLLLGCRIKNRPVSSEQTSFLTYCNSNLSLSSTVSESPVSPARVQESMLCPLLHLSIQPLEPVTMSTPK